jgi:hypothetical protein
MIGFVIYIVCLLVMIVLSKIQGKYSHKNKWSFKKTTIVFLLYALPCICFALYGALHLWLGLPF